MSGLPDFSRAMEIQRLEAAKEQERIKLRLATGNEDWVAAKAATVALADLDAKLVSVRSGPVRENVVGRFRVQG